ncbi:AAA family ATPase [Rhizorhapis suberifaciens]|uniref:Pilus assembly protein CpaE n=1 Tax=Rhizorhapis suberifaciens TaxID=13656 RepID=A0A840HTF5_9SPHN|nr:AAA family ATPase [Rhizorhapis suberifaciens]MBB4641213.1 pilus assembly protein CpaE [Rhizorhapis suberifaciens]
MGIVMKADGPASDWTLNVGENCVHMILSEAEIASADVPVGDVGGFSVALTMLGAGSAIPGDLLAKAKAVVVEVQPALEASMRRLTKLRADYPQLPIIAAVRNAELAVVRVLLKAGIEDVIALPLSAQELAAVLTETKERIAHLHAHQAKSGQLISVIKSVGGVGATTLATQAASLEARLGRQSGEQVCLFDLDVQFGNATTFLGLTSPLTLTDLLEAGNRVDADLLRSVTLQTPSGLHLVPAPEEIFPIEAVNPEQIYRIVDLATREFDTVWLDLPGNWTNWSLSLVARSQVVLLVVEMTIPSLRQARRQLSLLRSQEISGSHIQVVANRVEKKLFRSIGLDEAQEALGHPIAFTIANDFPLVNAALDQGVLIDDFKAKSKVSKDFRTIVDGCKQLLGGE